MPEELLTDTYINQAKAEFQKVLDHLKGEYAKLQVGRASPQLVEDIPVEAYGTHQPLKSLAQIAIPDGKSIRITPWDRGTLQAIEKAIQISDLHINPVNDGSSIHINIPFLTEERRRDLTKVVHRMAEEAKIAVRNGRQNVHATLRAMEQKSELTEDDRRLGEKELQIHVDKANEEIEALAKNKEEEVMKI